MYFKRCDKKGTRSQNNCHTKLVNVYFNLCTHTKHNFLYILLVIELIDQKQQNLQYFHLIYCL